MTLCHRRDIVLHMSWGRFSVYIHISCPLYCMSPLCWTMTSNHKKMMKSLIIVVGPLRALDYNSHHNADLPNAIWMIDLCRLLKLVVSSACHDASVSNNERSRKGKWETLRNLLESSKIVFERCFHYIILFDRLRAEQTRRTFGVVDNTSRNVKSLHGSFFFSFLVMGRFNISPVL